MVSPELSDAVDSEGVRGAPPPSPRRLRFGCVPLSEGKMFRLSTDPSALLGGGAVAVRTLPRMCYLVDPASSHMLVSKIKPCMCKYEQIQTVKLRMAH